MEIEGKEKNTHFLLKKEAGTRGRGFFALSFEKERAKENFPRKFFLWLSLRFATLNEDDNNMFYTDRRGRRSLQIEIIFNSTPKIISNCLFCFNGNIYFLSYIVGTGVPDGPQDNKLYRKHKRVAYATLFIFDFCLQAG